MGLSTVEPEGVHDVAAVIFQREEEREGEADTGLGNLPLRGLACWNQDPFLVV